jgi:ABC-2 type transport system ATP-binding protein
VLTTTGLSKVYGDRPALAPLDLTVATGERVALIGHNGSGKSTLLKLCVGLLSPSGGSATVDGHPAGSMPARSAISYLADNPTFYDDLSVWEHLEYVARLHGVEDWEPHATDLLEHLRLTERRDQLPLTFSRGLRQKAAIALAFVRPFELLLVDEPFVGLDAAGRDALLGLLDQAAADEATLVVATHELAFLDHADRMLVLAEGELVVDGPPDAEVARQHLG